MSCSSGSTSSREVACRHLAPFVARGPSQPRARRGAAPAVWLAWLACDGGLGARPVTEAIRMSGDWALRLLWLVLLIGPARRILGLPPLIGGRRILGIGAFGLAALHFALYAVDQHFNWLEVARETVLRLYLTIGAVAMVGLAAPFRDLERPCGCRFGSARGVCSVVYGIAALRPPFPVGRVSDVRADGVTRPPGVAGGVYALFTGSPRRGPTRALLGLAAASVCRDGDSPEAGWHGAETGVDPLRLSRAFRSGERAAAGRLDAARRPRSRRSRHALAARPSAADMARMSITSRAASGRRGASRRADGETR